MADRLVIERLEFEGFVGIDESERTTPQPLAVDLELFLDLSQAISTDNLQNTVDYATVAKKIVATAKQEQFCLIETLAERLAEVILEGPTIKEVRLWVRKLRPPLKISVGSVGARIARGCCIGRPSQNESAASWLVITATYYREDRRWILHRGKVETPCFSPSRALRYMHGTAIKTAWKLSRQRPRRSIFRSPHA